MSAVERDPAAQATLWRQRVFEVHAAMSAYLAERHRREDLGDWVATSARIFADLPATDDLRAEAWQAVFFRAQALIEQFIVARPADYRLDDWARATARIYRALEPAGRGWSRPAPIAPSCCRRSSPPAIAAPTGGSTKSRKATAAYGPSRRTASTKEQAYMNAIIEQARSLDGYQDSSELLQRRDQDWVLDRAGIEPRSLLDLGCGIGSLLLGGARRWPGLQRLWGIERSPLRLEQARAQLRGAGVEARLLEGDLLDLPPLAERFELISMTAVLHWLYPDEERLFRWVARHLEAQGVFLFTSHHPFAEDGLGGEDDLVAQALVEMGLAAPERVAALYAEAGLLPMGTRTRGREALRERVERHFRVDSIVSRPAVLRVADSAEYQRFHAATFGTYFAPLVPATRLEEFFVRLGRIAERRMQADGQVSEIPVSVWRCRAREGEA
ncbi:class I SAM-dependent methyltransferase [Pseudomonas aeruginosa]|nr:class I SAM-dependent methyltransferase [Pseudomonas aeruginosa]